MQNTDAHLKVRDGLRALQKIDFNWINERRNPFKGELASWWMITS